MIELLMTSMLMWMSANCDVDRIHPKHDPCKLNYNVSLPKIIFLPQRELKQLFYTNNSLSVGNRGRVDLYGFYRDRNRTIYLEDMWSRNKLNDKVTLFHELYHHVQFRNNSNEWCISHREIPIVMFQTKYVNSLGRQLYMPMKHFDASCNVYYKGIK